MQRALASVVAVLFACSLPVLAAPAAAADAPPAPAAPQPTAEAPFAVATVEAVAERDVPQICVTFTGRLEKSRAVDYRQWVSVTPAPAGTGNGNGNADAAALVARDRTLCVDGLQHGQTYTLTLRQGLPGADGAALAGEDRRDVDVPNRKPSMAFRGGGYILPRVGAEGLPLRTINVERAKLQVLRITDRALVEKIYFGRVAQQLSDPEVGELVEKNGQEVWKGEMAIDTARNTPVVTAFPIDAVLGKLEPGVYVAAAGTADQKPGDWASRATQWFLVSDIGLNVIRGEDGMVVFARSAASAQPAAGIGLRLLARDGSELARAASGEDGLARFDGDAVHGAGPKAPQVVFATREGADFSFLDLPANGGDAVQRPAEDAFVYAERGIYRPGESVDLTALLRDADARAIAGRPLTLKLLRPDGFEVERRTLTDAGAGAYTTRVTLPEGAATGAWRVTAHMEPDGPEVGRARFLVDDFVPPRLEVELGADRKTLDDGAPVRVAIDARTLGGAPAADLPGELTMTVRAAERPFPNHPGFRFGLAQEQFKPVRAELPGFTIDAAGHAEGVVTLPKAPDSSRPLEAVIRANVFDIGGRPVQRELVLPVRHQPFAIGIRPRFEGEGVPEGATAGFDVLAVDADGAPVARGDLSYELYEEEFEYVWYENNGRWDYQVKVKDSRVAGGTLSVAADKPAAVEEPVQSGRYRLEVFDPKAGVATSVRFVAGWWVTPTAADRPDKVDVTVMLPHYQGGDTAWVYVRPPYRSEVLIAVADRKVRRTMTRSIGPDGAFLEIPVDPSWIGGVHVLATAFAAADPRTRAAPRRAIGQSWLAIDSAPQVLRVAVSAPTESQPRQPVTATVSVAGVEAGQPAFVTLTAVDDAVLQLTDFAAPDPNDHFLGRRRPEVELRDSFGRLIDPAAGDQPAPRGEAPRVRQVGGIPDKSARVVSLFSGILPVGADGTVSVPVELPDFQGRVRLMAVAWSGAKLGHAETVVTVRDAVSADLSVPRFLVAGDTAVVTATLDNQSGTPGDYRLTLTAEGALALADGTAVLPGLGRGKRASVGRTLEAIGVGTGTVRMEVDGPDGFHRAYDWILPVRPGAPRVTRRTLAQLPPDKEVTVGPEAAAGLRPDTASVALSLSGLPVFDVPNLLSALERGPRGGAEQAASRVLPLLQAADLPGALDAIPAERVKPMVQRAIDRVMTLQRADGAFAQWAPTGEADVWLSAYVMDVLGRARTAGYRVADVPYRKGMEWLRGVIDNTWFDVDELPGRAYAHYVLARGKAVDAAAVRYFQEAFWPKLQTDMARAQVAAALALIGEGKRAAEAFDGLSHARMVSASLRDYGSVLRDEAAVVTLMAESGVVERDRIVAAADRLAKVYAPVSATSAQEDAWLLLAARAVAERANPVKLLVAGQPAEGAKLFHRRVEGAPLTVRNAGGDTLNQVVSVSGVPEGGAPGAVENGLSIRRSVFDMDGHAVDPANVRESDLIVVILEGAAADPLEHPALVIDPLPAGFAIENVRVADSGQLGDLSWLGALSPARHVEFRDDRFVAAVDLGKERQSFRLVYLARAVTPGDYTLPGAVVVDMVKPSLNARAAAGRVHVRAE